MFYLLDIIIIFSLGLAVGYYFQSEITKIKKKLARSLKEFLEDDEK